MHAFKQENEFDWPFVDRPWDLCIGFRVENLTDVPLAEADEPLLSAWHLVSSAPGYGLVRMLANPTFSEWPRLPTTGCCSGFVG
jgi:hypothetical protein